MAKKNQVGHDMISNPLQSPPLHGTSFLSQTNYTKTKKGIQPLFVKFLIFCHRGITLFLFPGYRRVYSQQVPSSTPSTQHFPVYGASSRRTKYPLSWEHTGHCSGAWVPSNTWPQLRQNHPVFTSEIKS